MATTKCSKCGEEYDSFSIHTCEEVEVSKKEKEKRKWETASRLRRIFMYHPDASPLVRFLSFLLLIPAIGGLGPLMGFFLLIQEVFLEGKSEFLVTYIYIIVVSTGALFISYGISHLKKWSLFLYGALLIFIFLMTGYILFGFVGILGFILTLSDYKKFH